MSLLRPWDKPETEPIVASAELIPMSPAPHNAPRSLAASGKRLYLNDQKTFQVTADRKKRTSWQSDAWDGYDLVGEIRFGANLIANTISRVNIFVGFVDDTARVPHNINQEPQVNEYLDLINEVFHLIDSGDQSSSEFLRSAALNLFVAGEFYFVRIPGNPILGIQDKFEVRSIDEVEFNPAENTVYLKSAPDDKKEYWTTLKADNYIARMWRRHPRYSAEADSSMKSILDDIDDLILYSREARAVSASRINNGLLFLPDSIDNSSTPDSDADEESDGSDSNETDLSEELSDILTEVVVRDGHANSIAPIILRGPSADGEKIKYIELSKSADQMYTQNIEFKLSRILSSLDLPTDSAKSLSNVKYSNGSVIEESLYKNHVEPMILMICDALTTGFLHPALRANGVPEELLQKIVVWYDPSAITAKPSKSESANFGIENNIISEEAWRTAHGYSEMDSPTEKQLLTKMLMNSGAIPPDTMAMVVNQLFPEMMGETRKDSLEISEPGSASALEEALATPEPGGAQTVGLEEQDTSDLIEP